MPDSSHSVSHTGADIIYDAFYSGAIGGSVVALFFLLIDTLNGQPLFTPSLMGSVLFAGSDAASVSGIDLGMVSYYTAVHFAVFGALGAGISVLVHEVELHSHHPAIVLGVLFAIFEIGSIATATLLLPGVTAVLGAVALALANLLAAGSIGTFLLVSHRPDLWHRLKHTAHLA